MRYLKIVLVLLLAAQLNGCVLTRLVTMPMRVVGGVLTIIPVAGDVAHKSIDRAADVVDKIPI
ncbi:MAG: hypothetical protein IMF07_06070 [Proteobacteria bacterium]|nr:hypothetical protein [Pseudomonadota bacterium]